MRKIYAKNYTILHSMHGIVVWLGLFSRSHNGSNKLENFAAAAATKKKNYINVLLMSF